MAATEGGAGNDLLRRRNEAERGRAGRVRPRGRKPLAAVLRRVRQPVQRASGPAVPPSNPGRQPNLGQPRPAAAGVRAGAGSSGPVGGGGGGRTPLPVPRPVRSGRRGGRGSAGAWDHRARRRARPPAWAGGRSHADLFRRDRLRAVPRLRCRGSDRQRPGLGLGRQTDCIALRQRGRARRGAAGPRAGLRPREPCGFPDRAGKPRPVCPARDRAAGIAARAAPAVEKASGRRP